MNTHFKMKLIECNARANPGTYQPLFGTKYRCIVRHGSKTVRWYNGSRATSRDAVEKAVSWKQQQLTGI